MSDSRTWGVRTAVEASQIMAALERLGETEWVVHASTATCMHSDCQSASWGEYVVHADIGRPPEVQRFVITNDG